MYPEDLRYTKDHEWVRIEGDRARWASPTTRRTSSATWCSSSFPEVGRKLQRARPFGTVESVKAVSELFSPVAGEVIAVNEALGKTPELVNSDPYGAAWLIELSSTIRGRRRRSDGRCRVPGLHPGGGEVKGRWWTIRGRSDPLRSATDGLFFRNATSGPTTTRSRRCSATIGCQSLDELVAQTVPPSIRGREPLDLPAARGESEALCRPARDRRPQPGVPLVHRHGLLRLRHAAGDPAEHPRESRLVHAVHALPGRDRAGAPRGAAQLPDHGRRPHRACRSRTRRCSTKPPPRPRR